MSHEEIVRVWKDGAYRESLDAQVLAAFPLNPAGQLDNADVDDLAGGEMIAPTANMLCTGWVCVTAVSAQLSCIRCDTTMWHGTCGVSSIGCCPA